jgi:hypothetical protein
MTDTNQQVKYELTRDQLAAHIPYEEAEGIAQLNTLGYQTTLKEAIPYTSSPEQVQRIVDRINKVSHE